MSAELEKSFRKQGITSHTGAKVTRRHGRGRRRRHRGAARRRQPLDDPRRLSAGGHRSRPGDRRAGGRARRACSSRRATSRSTTQYRTSVPRHFRDWRRHHARRARDIRSWRTSRRPRASSPPSGSRVTTSRPLNYDHVPGCTYCDPEIGSVGLTEREAQARGFDVRVGTFPFGVLGRAKIAGETEGFVKIVADKTIRRGAGRPHDRTARRPSSLPRRRSRCGSNRPSRSSSVRFTRIRRWRRRSAKRRTPCTARRYISSVRGANPRSALARTAGASGARLWARAPASSEGVGTPRTVGKGAAMATDVVMPQMGESIAEGTIVRWIKKVGDSGRSRRAAVRDLDRQGRRRDPVARRGRRDRDSREGRRDGSGQQRRRGHRSGGRADTAPPPSVPPAAAASRVRHASGGRR